MAAVVTPFPATSSPTNALLEATLAFERVVDALAGFQQRRGVLPSGPVPAAERARLRDGLLRLLNTLEPNVAAAAEARCAAHMARALPLDARLSVDDVALVVGDALDEYRRVLRQVPLRGVGAFV